MKYKSGRYGKHTISIMKTNVSKINDQVKLTSIFHSPHGKKDNMNTGDLSEPFFSNYKHFLYLTYVNNINIYY